MTEWTKLPPEKRTNARQLYHGPDAENLTNTMIAERVGVADTTIARWRRADKACRHKAKIHGEPTAKNTQFIEDEKTKAMNGLLKIPGWL